MSEYQYYEFQAIDRPLGDDDQRALRALSTRARITSTSFTNSYKWGDFKGEPAKLMERWFDLHLYLANWGTRRLMIRWPGRLVDRQRLAPFLRGVDCATLRVSGENLILDILGEELDLDEDWGDDGSGWLAGLAPLRADVLAGDLRLFYLLWLTGVETGTLEPDVSEPMPGMGPMTGALTAFADFFNLNPDIVKVAAVRPAAARTVGELRSQAQAFRHDRERAEAQRQPRGSAARPPKRREFIKHDSTRSRNEATASGARSRPKSNAAIRPAMTRPRAFSWTCARSPGSGARPMTSSAASARSANDTPGKDASSIGWWQWTRRWACSQDQQGPADTAIANSGALRRREKPNHATSTGRPH